MRINTVNYSVDSPGVVALVGMLVLTHWFSKVWPVHGLALRRPGADRPAALEQPVNLAGVLHAP